MHALQFTLFIYIHALLATAFESVPSAQLLPDPFALRGYEVLSVREEGDEDVVHIRKRGEDDCDDVVSDCAGYTGWPVDEGFQSTEQVNYDEGEDATAKRSLVKRDSRKDTPLACHQAMVDGKRRDGFYLISPGWDTQYLFTRHEEKQRERVYDGGEPTAPDKPEYYQLTKSYQGYRQKVNGEWDRKHEAEHILEWQMFADFLEETGKDDENSRCAHIHRFYLHEVVPTAPTVQVAKDDGKLNSQNRFDYEDKVYEFSKKWKVKYPKPDPTQIDPKTGQPKLVQTPVNARAIDYIGYQWPSGKKSARNEPLNPWAYEFVLLLKAANGKKENVWSSKGSSGGKNFFPKPIMDGDKMSQKNKDNSHTLEWTFANKYYDGNIHDYPENEGKCKAVDLFKTGMLILQYHNDPYVREVYRAQIIRVGEAFELMNQELQGAGVTSATTQGGLYIPIDLKGQWLDYMDNLHKKKLGNLYKTMRSKIPVFKDDPEVKKILRLRRWDYAGIFSRESPVKLCGKEPDTDKMKDRVKNMLDVWKNKMKAPKLDLKLRGGDDTGEGEATSDEPDESGDGSDDDDDGDPMDIDD